jgi:Skp family chaperone for outer membrane proteins
VHHRIAREDKRKEFERKGRELKYLYEDFAEEMGKAEAEEKKKILKELEVIVKRIGREGNYHLILETRSGGIMYFSGVIDLTDQLIKEYDETKP